MNGVIKKKKGHTHQTWLWAFNQSKTFVNWELNSWKRIDYQKTWLNRKMILHLMCNWWKVKF